MVGYDCARGICTVMMARKKELDLSIIHAIALWMPCIIILFSYITIWAYVWSHSKYLKQVGNIDIKKVIAKVVYTCFSLLHLAVEPHQAEKQFTVVTS